MKIDEDYGYLLRCTSRNSASSCKSCPYKYGIYAAHIYGISPVSYHYIERRNAHEDWVTEWETSCLKVLHNEKIQLSAHSNPENHSIEPRVHRDAQIEDRLETLLTEQWTLRNAYQQEMRRQQWVAERQEYHNTRVQNNTNIREGRRTNDERRQVDFRWHDRV